MMLKETIFGYNRALFLKLVCAHARTEPRTLLHPPGSHSTHAHATSSDHPLWQAAASTPKVEAVPAKTEV